jgi:ABC-type sugar transport system ATPase subunit
LASIELRQLTRFFGGGIAALHHLELTIPAGELLVVLGPSGSGKTTLLRLIAGLELPSSGSVCIGGQDVTGLPPHRRDVAMVFQHAALYPHLSIFDNLAFGIRARRVPRNQLRSKVNMIAGMLELDRLLSRKPAELSGGERQRVAIGRALVRQPRVILLDEPFSNLDLPLRTNLREQVIDLQRRFRTTLVHVTHDQAEALVMGHRVAILDHGRLLQVDSPRAIYENPAARFVARFVGSPPINIVPCQIEPEGEAVRIHPMAADGSLSWTTARAFLPGGWDGSSRQLEMGIRPEALSLAESTTGLESQLSAPRVSAQVRQVEFSGPDLLATLAIGPYRMVARLSSHLDIGVRDRVTVALDMSRTTWFDATTGAALRSL